MVTDVVLHALVVRRTARVLVVVAELAGRVVVRRWPEETSAVGGCTRGTLWSGDKFVVSEVKKRFD